MFIVGIYWGHEIQWDDGVRSHSGEREKFIVELAETRHNHPKNPTVLIIPEPPASLQLGLPIAKQTRGEMIEPPTSLQLGLPIAKQTRRKMIEPSTRSLYVYMDWGCAFQLRPAVARLCNFIFLFVACFFCAFFRRGHEMFAVPNYRSLESILAYYPNADVQVQIVAPPNVHSYKYANALSWTQFEKYQKRGYKVTMSDINRQLDRHFRRHSSAPGKAHWGEIRARCCIATRPKFNEERKILDSRLTPADLNFLRIGNLYFEGGLYLGFSFVMLRGVIPEARIADLGPNWISPVDSTENVSHLLAALLTKLFAFK